MQHVKANILFFKFYFIFKLDNIVFVKANILSKEIAFIILRSPYR